MKALAGQGAAAVIVKRDKENKVREPERKKAEPWKDATRRGKGLHHHIASGFTIIDAVVTFVILSLSTSLIRANRVVPATCQRLSSATDSCGAGVVVMLQLWYRWWWWW
ncbi:hypothetical protein PIB30_058977 [Stylosanthes scabra]|uniref:DUF1211 domain-containing protein n=1 Tax=Stylosanthes scabra TaxID=79078 RepID=A0ABU6TMA6_9FABA|nr:hypothetical protein [Stylosanthes scabra]